MSSFRAIAGAALALALALFAGPAPAALVNQRIGDWKLLCEGEAADGRPLCTIGQDIVDARTRARVLAVRLRLPPNYEAPVVTFDLAVPVVPDAPLGIAVDDDQTRYLPLDGCKAGHCTGTATLGPDLLERMRKGRQAILTFAMPDQDRPAGVRISLKGFDAALLALEQRR